MTSEDIQVGQRVRHADTKAKATVRFIGEIPVTNTRTGVTAPAVFYGIQYDLLGTGKYDGTYNGVQYFSTPCNSAAFVKRNKLISSASLGGAIRRKYLLDRNAEKIMTLTDGQLDKEVFFCGIEQVDGWHKQIQKMPHIGFQGESVGEIGDLTELKELIPSCQSLDLSDNLISNINMALLLFGYLENLEGLNLDNNYNLLLRHVTDETIAMLRNVRAGKKLSLSHITTEDNTRGGNEEDFNVLTRIACVGEIQFNDYGVNWRCLEPNSSLVSISLTGSIRLENIQELYELIRRFPGLREFTALDCLHETYETQLGSENTVRATQLTTLNLADSALSYDSLDYLFEAAPKLESFKILKVFHSKHTGLRSIFQSDQVIPLIAGCFHSTIRQVNAYEIKQKHISDYEIFYLRYLVRIGQPLSVRQAEQVITNRFCIPRAILTGAAAAVHGAELEQRGLLVDEDEQPQATKTENELVREQYNERLFLVHHGPNGAESLLVTRQTPIWKLRCQLARIYGADSNFILHFEGDRSVALETVRFTSLLEELGEYVCQLQVSSAAE